MLSRLVAFSVSLTWEASLLQALPDWPVPADATRAKMVASAALSARVT